MNQQDPAILTEETEITEITIQPDGRVYVFGASREALEVLNVINPQDRRVRAVLAQLCGACDVATRILLRKRPSAT